MNADDTDRRGRGGEAVRLKHHELTARAIGCFFELYNGLGPGFLEAVYVRGLAFALEDCGLRVEREVPLRVTFRGRVLGEYRADLVVEGAVVLEIKAVRRLTEAHHAQLIHYLRATGMEVGLLMNFGRRAEFRRMVLTHSGSRSAKSAGSAASCPDQVALRGPGT